jgi:hypothetical protein
VNKYIDDGFRHRLKELLLGKDTLTHVQVDLASHRRFCCVNKCQLVMDCGDTLFDQLGLAAFDTEKRAVFLVLDTCVVTMIRNRVEWLPRTNSSLCRLVALHADIKCNVAQYYSSPPNYIRLNLQSSLTLLNEIIPLIS